jgi:hypothetical protein
MTLLKPLRCPDSSWPAFEEEGAVAGQVAARVQLVGREQGRNKENAM